MPFHNSHGFQASDARLHSDWFSICCGRKMKMWNSWEYKYVALVDIDISKEGTEDGVYEATLTVQEMPIVTMYNQASTRGNKFVYKNPLLEKNGKKTIALLEKAGGDFMKKEQ
jgi:hypothetical protein